MNVLDDKKRVKRLDSSNALDSIAMLGDQLEQVFSEFKSIRIPKSYKTVNNVVHNGMGGSALGGHMIQSLFSNQLKKPFQVIHGYDLPACVNKDTLYLVVSYSGSTEEPLATVKVAQKSGAKIFAIAAGGKLAAMIQQGKINGYVFDPVANPSKQPRIGVGYTLAAELALFNKLGLISLSQKEITKSLSDLAKVSKKFGFEVVTANNAAKKFALQVKDKALTIVGCQHLSGNAHVFANQVNETAKTLANYHLIPELNHHLLEGLRFPSSNKKEQAFIFLESVLYNAKNQLRYSITKEVVAKNKLKHFSYKASTASEFSQALEVLAFSSYVSFYLAMLNNVNPNLIPFVDYFKKRLK